MNVILKKAVRKEIKTNLLKLCLHQKARDDDEMLSVLQAYVGVMMEDANMGIDMCFREGAMRPPPGPLPNEPRQGPQGAVPLLEEEEEDAEEMLEESVVHLELKALKREMRAMRKATSRANLNTERKQDRAIALSKISNSMHKKLYEAYSEFDYLLGDIKEEVSDGAPLPWEELGEGRGTWSPDRQ